MEKCEFEKELFNTVYRYGKSDKGLTTCKRAAMSRLR